MVQYRGDEYDTAFRQAEQFVHYLPRWRSSTTLNSITPTFSRSRRDPESFKRLINLIRAMALLPMAMTRKSPLLDRYPLPGQNVR